MSQAVNSRTLKTLAAFAATTGGVLHALKGVFLLTTGDDLSFVPAMVTLFALGLIGLSLLLQRRSIWQRIGLGASIASVAAGCASLVYLARGVAPEDFGSPTGVQIAYATGTFGILIALFTLGVEFYKSAALEQPWRPVPLVVGIVWFLLEGLTVVLPDGWGLLLAGLSWIPVGYCILRVRTDETKGAST
jgi:hypothetical protein